jgi:hypothetical protein
LQTIEDDKIAVRFSQEKLRATEFSATSDAAGCTLASAIAETLPAVELLSQPGIQVMKWSDLVEQHRDLWPIRYLLPGGASIHLIILLPAQDRRRDSSRWSFHVGFWYQDSEDRNSIHD